MAKPSYIFVQGLWDRIDMEIDKQGITRTELAKRCRFGRKNLYERRNLHLPYFARLCAELHISADYLLFGKGEKRL